MLADKYADRIEKIFAKYQDKRSAIMDLLYLAQEEYGWLSEDALEEVAALVDVDPTQAHSIAGFYTMYSEKPKGKYWFQVCTDLPCALRGADEFHAWLAACDKAPMMQCNFHYHENLDLEKVKALVERLRAEAAAEPTITE